MWGTGLFIVGNLIPMKRSYRTKTLNTQEAKVFSGLGVKMNKAMNKAIIKFDLYRHTHKIHNIKLKFPVKNSEKLKGEIIDCVNYESRSGLHWSRCYIRDEKCGVVVPYYGSVRKLKTVAMISPTVYDDIYKPIPREGKNVVRLDLASYKRLQQSLLLLMNNILIDNRNLLLYCNEDIAEVAIIRFYDYRIRGLFIGNQSNLEMYWIDHIPKALKMERTTMFAISGHVLEFSEDVRYIRSEPLMTSRYDIEAAIIRIKPGTRISVFHKEHGEKKIEINDYRITNLLALHISSRYVE